LCISIDVKNRGEKIKCKEDRGGKEEREEEG
jgi:hypothetical protein